MRIVLSCFAALIFPAWVSSISAADSKVGALRPLVESRVAAEYASLEEVYKDLHAHPELSFQEARSAGKVAAGLREAGFEVAERVGGHGVVGVLRNGEGPAVLVRSDMDALPVQEQTGLPYASRVRATGDGGAEVDVMHACGHDAHMTCLIGTARLMAGLKDRWCGTLVFIGQPAEERTSGAKAMLEDGLFTRFPRPQYCLALHMAADMPAGSVGYTEGYALASSDAVEILIRGVGGHGAFPHRTKDPVVLAAQVVLALQTIVSRETKPTEPSVVTVGSIHGGTKNNIIPDEVRLQLTLRSYSDEVREHQIAAIRRIARGLALAAGLPEERMPIVTLGDASAKATYNDPALTRRLAAVFETWLGKDRTTNSPPVMGAEDFGFYGRTEDRIPSCIFWVGAVEPARWQESKRTGVPLPSLHSSQFHPVLEASLKTGITAMTAALLEIAGKP